MYLKKIICENMGPISSIGIDLGFNENGTPKPIVFVGKNGTGKSVLISNIVDALIEFGSQAYDDVAVKISLGHSYFKTIAGNQIRSGENHMTCFLGFSGEIEKEGKMNPTRVFPEYCYHIEPEDQFDSIKSHLQRKLESSEFNLTNFRKGEKKSTSPQKDFFEKEFATKSFLFLPPDRFTIPYWMGGAYSSKHGYGQLAFQSQFRNQLNKPVIVFDSTDENTRWLMDVIVDSKLDTPGERGVESGFQLSNGDILASLFIDQDTQALNISKRKVEDVASEILEKKVTLNLGNRSFGNHRLRFLDKDGIPIAPTFDALSTGQCILLNMFLTIIRYADKTDLNKSIHLSEISGIVVVDEIELHLHSDLQRNILPKLIKLFPRVQFLITTHSPLFLLGMEKEFGKSGFDIYEMPNAEKIFAEEFSEFGKAYDAVCETSTFRKKIREVLNRYDSLSNKVLIVTEGATDWKHMKRAWLKFRDREEYASIKDKIEFLEYEPDGEDNSEGLKLKMCDTELVKLCKYYSKIPRDQGRTIIFVSDADNFEKTKDLVDQGKSFKKWDSKIYSFQIPVPAHRQNTPEVCIEHYYTDAEIKTEKMVNGVARRLFLGNEFDSRGISLDCKYFCQDKNKCGPKSISIIDGNKNSKVTSLKESTQNLALPKMEFAEAMLNNEDTFDQISSENFHMIFDIIKKIVDLA